MRPVSDPPPCDGHVHTEWSWDTMAGSMERTCQRARDIGLPAVAFTDHADATPWVVHPAELPAHLRPRWHGGLLRPPPLDAAGYHACLQRCRDLFPDLRILSGVELGEPHWYPETLTALQAAGDFDRVLGSLHSLRVGDQHYFIDSLYQDWPAAEVIRAHLAETVRMVESGADFAVLAHIDYPVRQWPADAGPYDPVAFEEEYRVVLAALACSGRALEVNTKIPLHAEVVRWWYEAGGDAVSFGSDAHDPEALARGLADAAAMVEACGFRPGRHPYDLWRRSGT